MPEPEAIPPEIRPIDYVRRWRDKVERRRAQMESAYAAAGIVNADYWGKRARQYRDALHDRADQDPFLLRLLDRVTPDSTVLDVGAGTGRHTLALAPHVAGVTAVDPSSAMLGFLREDVAAQGMSNVSVVESDWLTADVPQADFVICSHVLYPIADVTPFVRKLAAAAAKRVLIYLRVDALATDMGLWRDFHGIPLEQQPLHLDLVNLLAQEGIQCDVEIVSHRFSWTFVDIDEAVTHVWNSLCLREDDPAATEKLRTLLERMLVPHPGGRIGPDVGSSRSAIISWAPGA